MILKYDINISEESFHQNIQRLTNQLWKLIPMRENEENWKKQLDNVILEIVGLNELCSQDPLFLQLLSKLEGLKFLEIDFMIYRKVIFDCINLLQEINKNNER